jgi:hypothetical protein
MSLANMRASGVRTLAAWCLGRGGNHHRVLDVGGYLGGCPRTETFSPRLSLRRGGHSNTPTKNLPLETGGHLLS